MDKDQNKETALGELISALLCEGKNVSVPGFGTFAVKKHAEYVAVNADGNRMLYPPRLTVELIPGSRLKKIIAQNG